MQIDAYLYTRSLVLLHILGEPGQQRYRGGWQLHLRSMFDLKP
jgi:hypothetical protein